MESIEESDAFGTTSSTATLLCLTESLMGGMGEDERVNFGLIAVTPATGEVVYDDFPDTATRPELEVSGQPVICTLIPDLYRRD
jgi:hypothetical protein